MNKDDAQKEVTNIGVAYFQDRISDFETTALGLNSIFEEIKDHASSSRRTGVGSWEKEEEATRVALEELRIEELDRILQQYYGINPEVVGGSKAFFEKLHTTIQEGTNEARQRHSPK